MKSEKATAKRRESIIALLKDQEKVRVDELSRHFSTSEVTIRKDLTALEKEGWLVRRHGGAVKGIKLSGNTNDTQIAPSDIDQAALYLDTPFDSKDTKVSNRKVEIARLAAELVRPRQRIMIDYGSTTTALVNQLNGIPELVIMTNSLRTARSALALNPQPTLLMSGGTWDVQSQSFQGQIAEQTLGYYDFDICFVGCDGIDPLRGTQTFNEHMNVSRTMANSAKTVVVLAESSKLGRKIPNLELSWSQIDILVTDDGLDQDARHLIDQHGVNIMIAAKQ